MPRYFFNLRNDPDAPDEEGKELPDLAAARAFALENAREMVGADVRQGWLDLDQSIEVTDDRGAALFTLAFRDAFEVRGRF